MNRSSFSGTCFLIALIILSPDATANAIAAINAGFFNIKNGGSVTYIKTAGRIKDIDTAKKWSRNANMTGSFLIKSGKEIFITCGV